MVGHYKKKIIFCNSLPTSRVFADKLNLNYFENKNYIIEFWDLSKLYLSENNINKFFKGNPKNKFISNNYITINSKEDFLSLVKKNKSSIFFYLTRFVKIIDDDWIIELFNKNEIKYFFQHFDSNPFFIYPKKFTRFIKSCLKYLDQRYKNKICKPLGIFTSGKIGYNQVKIIYPQSKPIMIESIKTKWNNFNNIVDNKYMVFVDEAVIEPPDVTLINHAPSSDVKNYYFRMAKFFDFLEDIFKIEVIIAVSLKYNYRDSNLFGKRKIYINQTFDLINYSELVIGHSSLALQQAAVSKKKLLLVSDSSFTDIKKFDMTLISDFFKKKHISNLSRDKNIIFSNIESNNNENRAIKKYLKLNKEDPTFNEAFINIINSIV